MPYRDETIPVEERLRRTLVHLDAAQRIARIGSWQSDLEDGGRLRWSPQARTIAGWPDDAPEPSFERFVAMLHPEDRERFVRTRRAALAGEGSYAVDCRLVRGDGTVRHLHIAAEIERDPDGRPVRAIGVVRDDTDTVRLFAKLADLEDARHRLLHRLMRTAERERILLAADLHDGPIQELSALALQLQDVATESGHEAEAIEDIAGGLRGVIDDLRTTLFDLQPLSFGRESLARTLEQMALALVPGLECTVVDETRGDLDEDVATAVLRIAQEALHNVGKHSGASQVAMTLRRHAGDVLFRVVDDGGGFDIERAPEPGHLGLVAMRERAAVLGGTVTIDSRPGRTTVEVRLPRR